MSVFILILLEGSVIYDKMVCLGKEDADLMYERWLDMYSIDKETAMNGDESMQIIYFQSELIV